MMPLVDRPFVAHQLDLLRRHGVTDVIFSCGYRPDALRHFGDEGSVRREAALRRRFPSRSALRARSRTPSRSSTARSSWCSTRTSSPTSTSTPSRSPPHRGGRHRRPDAGRGPERLRPRAPVSGRLGGGVRGEAGAERCAPESPFINAGTTCSSVCARADPRRPCVLDRARVFRPGRDRHLYGFPSEAYWRDIGTPASYLAANRDVEQAAVHLSRRPARPPPGRRSTRRAGRGAFERGAGGRDRRRGGGRGQRHRRRDASWRGCRGPRRDRGGGA